MFWEVLPLGTLLISGGRNQGPPEMRLCKLSLSDIVLCGAPSRNQAGIRPEIASNVCKYYTFCTCCPCIANVVPSGSKVEPSQTKHQIGAYVNTYYTFCTHRQCGAKWNQTGTKPQPSPKSEHMLINIKHPAHITNMEPSGTKVEPSRNQAPNRSICLQMLYIVHTLPFRAPDVEPSRTKVEPTRNQVQLQEAPHRIHTFACSGHPPRLLL